MLRRIQYHYGTGDPLKDPKLKSCPFCGGKATIGEYCRKNEYSEYDVGCENEDCHIQPLMNGSCDTKEEATERWNKRC